MSARQQIILRAVFFGILAGLVVGVVQAVADLSSGALLVLSAVAIAVVGYVFVQRPIDRLGHHGAHPHAHA